MCAHRVSPATCGEGIRYACRVDGPILFDLDGTLVDSIADIAAAMNHVLASAGLPTHDLSAYAAFVGAGAPMLVRRAAPEGADLGDLLARFVAHYAAHALDATRPYPEIAELVADLRARGRRLAVLSNKPDALTQKIVAACFPAGSFDAVMGDVPGVPRKPDPTSAIALADRLGAPPSMCWLVGDTEIDIRTAAAAGMRSIAVTWGLRPVEELVAAAPDRVAHDVNELASILGASTRG